MDFKILQRKRMTVQLSMKLKAFLWVFVLLNFSLSFWKLPRAVCAVTKQEKESKSFQ